MRRPYWFVIPILLAALLVTGLPTSRAQDEPTTIRLAIPEYTRDLFSDDLIAQFEAENPGIKVQIVPVGGADILIGGTGPQGEIEDVLDDSAEYASTADVLAVGTGEVTPETTRAGAFLDLAPLALTDPALNPDDFYPAAWEAFRWDGGLWALPVTADPTILFYDPAAFDAAGLPYPDTWRTLDDMANAVRALTQFNEDGTVAVSGFQSFGGSLGQVILSLLGVSLYDQNTLPGLPNFSQPELENLLTALLTTWAELDAEGYLDQPVSENLLQTTIPLRLSSSRIRLGNAESERAALLPGGRAGLSANGFAVSSGTQHPEAAYALARFLTTSPQAASAFFGGTAARRSLAGTQAEGEFAFGPLSSPEIDAVIQAALESALPAREMFFAGYLDRALDAMRENGLDAHTALQQVEEEAITRLDTASARRGSSAIVVATPVPAPDLAPGEIGLTFGVNSFISPLPNQDAWDALARDFAASDPEVGQVTINSSITRGFTDMAEQTDCFYMFYNAVPDADLSLLRSLDPLMASDPAYDPNDMIGGALSAVQRDGSTWAMPLVVQPLAMRYNPALFEQVGAIPPAGGWTVDEFENALRALKDLSGEDVPFQPQAFDNSVLLMLIAAYGGLPIDYRTTPPTINFTDPATVEAIRQVLNLAKEGLITYSRLANVGGMAYGFSVGEEQIIPLYTEVVNGFGVGGGPGMMMITSGDFEPPQNTDLLTPFPQGRTYTPVAFDVSGAYISAHTPHAEACYRFISALAGRLDLVQGMPARRSLITHPDLAAAQGPDTAAFYTLMDSLMQQPNTVTLPTSSINTGGGTGFMLNFWLNRAFDRYVLEDADLDRELADAQLFTQSFLDCAASLPPLDPAAGNLQASFEEVIECAVQIDPSIEAYFSP